MAKIEVSKVAEILKKQAVSPQTVRKIIEEMNIATEVESDEEKLPAVKKQFIVLVSDPDGQLRELRTDFVAWVLQIPESESPVSTQDRIIRAVQEYNTTKKGRLYPAKTIGEGLENVPSKFFKEAELWVKTKTPVLVLRTDNKIPQEDQFI